MRVVVGVKLTVYKTVEIPDHVWEAQHNESLTLEATDHVNEILNDAIAAQMPELGTGYDDYDFDDEWYDPVKEGPSRF